MPGFGPITQGIADRIGGGGPPAPGPAPGPQMGMEGPPGMGGGGDPMQELAMHLGEARVKVGEMGPERFPEAKSLLKGFVISITQLQESFAGGGAPQAQGNPQLGPPGMPPGGAGPMPPPGPPMPPGPQMTGPR